MPPAGSSIRHRPGPRPLGAPSGPASGPPQRAPPPLRSHPSEADVRIEERADWVAPEAGTEAEHHVPGTRLWRIELPAGGTAALDGGYAIRIPAGKALTGGNRRS